MSLTPEDKNSILQAIMDAKSLSALDMHNLVTQIPGMNGANGGSYFEGGKLMVELLGDAICDGLALGPDGSIWVYADGVFAPAPDEVKYRTTRALGNSWTRNRAAEVQENLISRRVLPELPELPDSEVINLANGIYHWSTGHLFEHDPKYRMTARLDVAYDAEATCPKFSSWLAGAVPADALQTTWEALGYALLFGNPLQRAVLLHGPRGSGKSTYLKMIEYMVGPSNVSHVSLRDMAGSRFRVAQMVGKVANIMGDIDAKYLEDPSLFKAITGADTIQVEQKYQDPKNALIWATPIFSSNMFWRTGDTTDAYLERFTVLSFPKDRRFQDDDFSMEALYAEASGIFNLAMHHLRNLMARGDFEIAGSLAELQNEFRKEADIVRLWLAEDDAVEFNEAGSELVRTKRSLAYNRYRVWSISNGHKSPLASDQFFKRMTAMGYIPLKSSDRYILGLGVKAMSADWELLAQ